jgi:EAL domain-containing protein (putative c-di-GMP-specific phosphodiesterase class I)
MTARPEIGEGWGSRSGYLRLKSALYDRVTGLPSLPLLFDRLRGWLEHRRSIGVLHVEVVDLVMVESLYGWQVFDRIVAHCARALEGSRGAELPEDTLIALNGVAGDRFVLFVADKSTGHAVDPPFLAALSTAVCRRLERAFDDERFAGLSPELRFRAGHALLSANPFYRFERCVYAAVEAARGMHGRREDLRERSWGDELEAIIRDGAVRTLFQPVVELETRRVVGHEALSRGPRDSLFEMPGAMFALSGRVGAARELDRVCQEAAIASSRELAARGKLFLNIRPESLEPSAALDPLRAALARHGLEPTELVLEVSERRAAPDDDLFVARLGELKRQGFEVALDDVGTGRTRLAAIERLAPDYLKIDVSLVRNVHQSLMQQEVLTTLVRLADGGGGSVVGEGVELEDEAAALLACGARYGQGQLYALPAAPRPGRPLGRRSEEH